MNDRILEPEIELPAPDDWAGEEAIRSFTGETQLGDLVAAYLAKGGAIQTVPEGVSMLDGFTPMHGGAKTMEAARKRGAKVSVAARRGNK